MRWLRSSVGETKSHSIGKGIFFYEWFWFSGATTDNLPSGVLYRVKAMYKYVREDSDELCFDVGEIIHVVEYDDPEEQVRPSFFFFFG